MPPGALNGATVIHARHFTMQNIWPDRVFLRVYVRRAALGWAAVHAVLAGLTQAEVIVLPSLASAILLLVIGFGGVLDAQRRNEILFLQNLGVPRAVTAISWMCVAAALEASLAITLASFGYAR